MCFLSPKSQRLRFLSPKSGMQAFEIISADAERIQEQTVYFKHGPRKSGKDEWKEVRPNGRKSAERGVVYHNTTGSSGKQCRPAQLRGTEGLAGVPFTHCSWRAGPGVTTLHTSYLLHTQGRQLMVSIPKSHWYTRKQQGNVGGTPALPQGQPWAAEEEMPQVLSRFLVPICRVFN